MQFLSRKKKKREEAAVSGVANPSPAPALNIFNGVKLEKLNQKKTMR